MSNGARKKIIGYWDVHCHLLPGVDDGAGSMTETMKLIGMEYRQGVRKIVFTPHYRKGLFEIPLDAKEEVFNQVVKKAEKKYPDMEFYLGCEYHTESRMMDRIMEDARYRMPKGQAVLVEFSYTESFRNLLQVVKNLVKAGLIPVVAHFERYECLRKDITRLKRLKKEGAMLQVNCKSLIGKEGLSKKMFCGRALMEGYVDLLGTDAHNTESRSVHMEEAARYIWKKKGDFGLRKILQENPERLFGTELDEEDDEYSEYEYSEYDDEDNEYVENDEEYGY